MIEFSTGVDYPPDFITKSLKHVDFSEFSYSWTVIIVFGLLMLLTAKKDMAIFIKIATYGVIFTIFIIIFVISVGAYGLGQGGYTVRFYRDNINDSTKPPVIPAKSAEILLFGSAYNHLLGILAGGFYLHNISLPIYRNSKYPENSIRDIFLGFLAVCLSYIVCGTLGAIGFSSIKTFPG